MACLKTQDIACANIAHVSIPKQSIYAKILEANLAVAQQTPERVLELLLPISSSQALTAPDLSPEAVLATYHALAWAYTQQDNHAQSLAQYTLADDYLSSKLPTLADAHANNQIALANALNTLPQTTLISLRGEIEDSTQQGWVDLLLTARALEINTVSLELWRKSYPDHPATQTTLAYINQGAIAKAQKNAAGIGKMALLLPLQNAHFYHVADAIERGFNAAKSVDNDQSELALYPTSGEKEAITSVYDLAVNEGAKFVIGPLTRDEVTLLAGHNIAVPTITLNQPENPVDKPLFYNLGLTIDSEAEQLVKYAQKAGMQSVRIISEESPLAKRMAQSFSERWLVLGGKMQPTLQLNADNISEAHHLEIKNTLQNAPCDMILIAGNHDFAKKITAVISNTVPVFGYSHIYSGINADPEDASLNATLFVDLPWVLNPSDKLTQAYQSAAESLPPGQQQRWFALGADAYLLLKLLHENKPLPMEFMGLTGKISISADRKIQRDLPLARFTPQGITVESRP